MAEPLELFIQKKLSNEKNTQIRFEKHAELYILTLLNIKIEIVNLIAKGENVIVLENT